MLQQIYDRWMGGGLVQWVSGILSISAASKWKSSGCSDDTGPAQKKGPAGGVGYLPLLVAAAI